MCLFVSCCLLVCFLGNWVVHFDESSVYTWLLPLLLQFDRRGRSPVQLSASLSQSFLLLSFPSHSLPPSSLLPPAPSASSLHEFMEAHSSGCPLPGPAGDPTPQSRPFSPHFWCKPQNSLNYVLFCGRTKIGKFVLLFAESELANIFLHFVVRQRCAIFSHHMSVFMIFPNIYHLVKSTKHLT